jgi:ankyrin repeat protein
MASTMDVLFAAIAEGDVDRVHALLEAEPALADARDHDGVSALMRARYRLDPDMVEAIRARAADLDVFEAATFGDLARLDVLLEEHPAAARSRSADGFTPLHLAAFFGQPDAARRLLGAGAEVDALGTGWMKGTPLHSAASASHTDVAEILLAAGADPDARQEGGWTPLHAAAANGNVALVGALLAAGGDRRAANDDGRTAADLAGDDAVREALAAG